MSFEAYQAAWAANCSGGLKLTLLAIAESASKANGYTCQKSIGTLAEMIGTKPRQIERNLRELEENGLIKTRVNRGRGNTNVYDMSHLLEQKPVTEDTIPVTDDGYLEGAGGELATGNPSSVTGFSEENLSSGTQNPSSRTRKPVIDDTQDIYNQKNNIYIPPDPEPIAAIKTALSVVSKTPFWTKTFDDYDQAAQMIAGWGNTADDVKAFAKWWAARGFHKGKPVLRIVLQEFPNFVESRSPAPNGNGHHAIDGEALEALLKRMEVNQ